MATFIMAKTIKIAINTPILDSDDKPLEYFSNVKEIGKAISIESNDTKIVQKLKDIKLT
ncbi:MAG: hypothetical protein ACTTJS_07900 [Wolinella sp.]